MTIRSVAVRLDDRCCDVTLTDGSKAHVSFDIEWHSRTEHTVSFGSTIQHLSVRLHLPEDETRTLLAERISTVVRAAEIKAAVRLARMA